MSRDMCPGARLFRFWAFSWFALLALGAMNAAAEAQEIMRLAAWNTANGPNGPKDAEAFRTILGAMGDEELDGISKRLDILALSDTDTASSQALVGLMNDLYGVESYQVVTSSPNGGGVRTGFLYDSSTVALLDSEELTEGLTHNILSAQFRPHSLSTEEAFSAYAVHLKAGDSASDAAIRGAEATILNDHAARLLAASHIPFGAGPNVLFAGDFNMPGTSEPAWDKMTQGLMEVSDVALSDGQWRDNSEFLHLHTNDPGSNLSDRFDLMLSSEPLMDGCGLDVRPESFRVFGNNGTHTLGGSIQTGTGALPEVLLALATASDHLPVVADILAIPPPRLSAGDADMDLDHDQLDNVQILQAGKYLTGEPATWGEGDWDGAPGGSPGDPPAGNGLFDQLDLIAALGTSYMTGPYADFPCGRLTGIVPAPIAPVGVLGDDQTSVVYDPQTGAVAVDAPANKRLTSINIDSAVEIFTGARPHNLEGTFDTWSDRNIFKGTFVGGFDSISFGNVAQTGLTLDFVLNDLTVVGSLEGGGGLGEVDLVYMHELLPGDANRDFSFDQLDIVQVLQAGKYLTGSSATWGEGDWDGGPGGYPGEPPTGDGIFDQKDVVAALQTGAYLAGPYAAIRPGGVEGDEQMSIIYDARTGEIAVDAPASTNLTSVNIDSAGRIFIAENANRNVLGSSFDTIDEGNIFKSIFNGVGFGSISFGNMAPPGLPEAFMANDLTVVGSLAGGGDIGQVDLIYIPEPSSLALLAIALGIFYACRAVRPSKHRWAYLALALPFALSGSVSAGQISLTPESVIGGSGAWGSESWASGPFAAG